MTTLSANVSSSGAFLWTRQSYHELNCKQCHHGNIGLMAIHTINLLATVYIKPSHVTINHVGCEILCMMHGPKEGYFGSLDKFPVVIIDINFIFYNGFYKLSCTRLLDHLMKVNDIPHHICMECTKSLMHLWRSKWLSWSGSGLVWFLDRLCRAM